MPRKDEQQIAASLNALTANAHTGTGDQPLHLGFPLTAKTAADRLFIFFCHEVSTAFLNGISDAQERGQ